MTEEGIGRKGRTSAPQLTLPWNQSLAEPGFSKFHRGRYNSWGSELTTCRCKCPGINGRASSQLLPFADLA